MFSNHTHLANVSLTLRILPAAFQKVAIERLELSTLALLARCSNRLSYTSSILLGSLTKLFKNQYC